MPIRNETVHRMHVACDGDMCINYDVVVRATYEECNEVMVRRGWRLTDDGRALCRRCFNAETARNNS